MTNETSDSALLARDPVETVAAHLRTWQTPHVDLAIFESADPELIVATIDGFCRAHLGRRIEGYLLFVSSQASTHAVELEDGERVVVKIHQPPGVGPERTSDAEKLRTVQRALVHLRAQGFPCPRPLLGPTPLARGTATVESFLAGQRGDGLSADQRRALAHGLVEHVAMLAPIADSLPGLDSFFRSGDRLFPPPHSKLFDFDATGGGAEWIDDIARRARQAISGRGPTLLGHGDWRAEHVRFEGDRIVASFDWDSLSRMTEAELVGLTASQYTTDHSSWEGGRVPPLDAVFAFLDEYGSTRGRDLDPSERADALAMCTYGTAYGARCLHSLAPDTARDAWEDGTWPYLLAELDRALDL